MQMSVLINENQKKILIKESLIKDIGDTVKNNFEFAKEILQASKEQMGINLQFLLTWGASIGGFVGPLTQFVEGENPELTPTQVTSIMIGITATYYLDNKKTIYEILKKIKEDGLGEVFVKTIKKAEKLKSSFLSFIESLNLTFHKVSNMMTYTFIIPLVEKILQMSQGGEITDQDIRQLALRIGSFGLLTVSSIAVVSLVKRMVKRFRDFN
jgi:hypothetical protein